MMFGSSTPQETVFGGVGEEEEEEGGAAIRHAGFNSNILETYEFDEPQLEAARCYHLHKLNFSNAEKDTEYILNLSWAHR